MGEPADAFFASRELLNDFLTRYFTDFEPQSCFVAEASDRVVGYLIGAKNEARFSRVFNAIILPRLLMKAALNGVFFSKKNMTFIFYCLVSWLRREFETPDFSKEYPALLHINVEKDSRSLGLGSKLIAAYLDYLAKEGVSGVHLATMSEKASGFFRSQGFKLLYRSQRSYFRYILHKDIPVYIYGRNLS